MEQGNGPIRKEIWKDMSVWFLGKSIIEWFQKESIGGLLSSAVWRRLMPWPARSAICKNFDRMNTLWGRNATWRHEEVVLIQGEVKYPEKVVKIREAVEFRGMRYALQSKMIDAYLRKPCKNQCAPTVPLMIFIPQSLVPLPIFCGNLPTEYQGGYTDMRKCGFSLKCVVSSAWQLIIVDICGQVVVGLTMEYTFNNKVHIWKKRNSPTAEKMHPANLLTSFVLQ